MKFINTKTKVVIDSNMKITGGNWVLFDGKDETDTDKEVETQTVQNETVEEETSNQELDGIDGITVKDIKQELDAQGIEYDPKAKKQELYDLMMQGN